MHLITGALYPVHYNIHNVLHQQITFQINALEKVPAVQIIFQDIFLAKCILLVRLQIAKCIIRRSPQRRVSSRDVVR